jgi:hypothetical protein
MSYKPITFNADEQLQEALEEERAARLDAGFSRMASTKTAIILDALQEFLNGEDK